MKINGYDIGRAAASVGESVRLSLSTSVMGDGSVRQRQTGQPERTLDVVLPRVTMGTWENLKPLLEYYAHAGAPITIIDDYSVAYLARVWSSDIKAESRLGRFWTVRLTFRLEN